MTRDRRAYIAGVSEKLGLCAFGVLLLSGVGSMMEGFTYEGMRISLVGFMFVVVFLGLGYVLTEEKEKRG
ncbi:MAG: hypothetical protein LBU03_02400 [Tannerellaceae bacterium]|nr:hypothetical protein [Tannerellaceae bacterium]